MSLYERLTVLENLEYYSALYGCHLPNSLIDELAEKLDFKSYLSKRTETLSRGMQQRVTIAVALLNNPRLVLFDEPTIGLDVSGQMVVKDVVRHLKAEKKTVIYSTNIITEISEVCDKVLILNKGKQIIFDSIEAIEADHRANLEDVFLDIIGAQS